jgi:hypothetical protein
LASWWFDRVSCSVDRTDRRPRWRTPTAEQQLTGEKQEKNRRKTGAISCFPPVFSREKSF